MASSGDATSSTTVSEPSSSTGSKEATPKVRLQAKDGEIFVVDLPVAKLSKVIKQMIDDLSGDRPETDFATVEPIPLPNVSGPILHKIIAWMEYHYKTDGDQPDKPDDDYSHFTDEISDWDKEFMKVDQGSQFELLVASNYLSIKKLRTVVCKTIAEILKTLTVEQIREKFGIVNDFAPDEEEAIRKENEWCEDQEETPKA